MAKRIFWLFMSAETFAVLLGLSYLQTTYRSQRPLWDLIRPEWLMAFGLVHILTATLLGLPSPELHFTRSMIAGYSATILAALLFSFLSLVAGPWLLPRPVIVGAITVVAPAHLCVAGLARLHWRRSAGKERVLFIGPQSEYEKMILESDQPVLRSFSLCGVLDAGVTDDCIAKIESHDPTLVVITEAAKKNVVLMEALAVVHTSGCRVRSQVAFFQEWLGKLPVQELAELDLFFDIAEVHSSSFNRAKRVLDVVVGAIGAIVVIPIMGVVLLANRIANRGPLFYAQQRVGLNRSVFSIYKFRTMRPHNDAQPEWTKPGDPRITRFGRLLRKTHIDELPQVLNLLKGDISLVGPRPEQVHYVEKLREEVPHYDFRHSIRPGITGWAQVNYSYGASVEDSMEKLEYDLYYLANQSIALDFGILIKTFGHTLWRGGS